MKSAGVYVASDDFAKCGLAEIKFSGWQCRLVKLQRPPPEIRIFFPMRPARSRTTTCRPCFPASIAHISPAAPPPRMTTSNWCFTISDVRVRVARALAEAIENPLGDRIPARPPFPSGDEQTGGWPHAAQPGLFGAPRLRQGCTCDRR